MNIRTKWDIEKLNKTYVLGIDEVGWGCVAGPVFLGGCLIHKDFYNNYEKLVKEFTFFEEIKDSKKLSEKKRIDIFSKIQSNPWFSLSIGEASTEFINQNNLATAYTKAFDSIISSVLKTTSINDIQIIIDGSRDPKSNILNNQQYELVIKGDDTSFCVSVASLFAKEKRDQFMRDLNLKINGYEFDLHKGYGTKKHTELIKKLGLSCEHRLESSKKLIGI